MSDAGWERMESDPAWAEEWEEESSEEWSEEDADDRGIGAAGAASSSSGTRREGEREVGDWRPVGEAARRPTYTEIVGQQKALMVEEGRARQGVEREAVDEERREATKFWRVWKVVRSRTAMAGGGHATDRARVLCHKPASLDRQSTAS